MRTFNGNMVPMGEEFATPPSISRRQFFQILAIKGYITKEEALAATNGSSLPTEMFNILEMIPDEDIRWDAQMNLTGSSEFEYSNPFVDFFRVMKGLSEYELKQLWKEGYNL